MKTKKVPFFRDTLYRIRYRKEFGIEKSIGIGIENIWYQKKIRIRFRSDFGYRHTLIPTRPWQNPGQKSVKDLKKWSKNYIL